MDGKAGWRKRRKRERERVQEKERKANMVQERIDRSRRCWKQRKGGRGY